MSKNDSDNGIYITYKADEIDVPEEDHYLLLKGNNKKEDNNNIKISWNIGHTRGYINKITDSADYNKIIKLINNMKWNKIKEKRINENTLNKNYYNYNNIENLMDVINKPYDETIYSNMFFYFFNNKKMFKGFAKDILNLNLSNNIKLYKEKATYSDSRYGRIDLLAVDEENKICIVIENKLKSAINGRYYSDDAKTEKIIHKSQLYKYVEWANSEKTYGNYVKKYFIFVPNYKIKELVEDINENNLMPKDNNGNDMFKIISYYDIFKYFNKESLKSDMKNNKYYEDFVISLSKHIYTLDEEMERRFVSTIKNRII